jgi:hypothetical protein
MQNHAEFSIVETYADQAAIDYHTKSAYYKVSLRPPDIELLRESERGGEFELTDVPPDAIQDFFGLVGPLVEAKDVQV